MGLPRDRGRISAGAYLAPVGSDESGIEITNRLGADAWVWRSHEVIVDTTVATAGDVTGKP
jgi:hypothetical protein